MRQSKKIMEKSCSFSLFLCVADGKQFTGYADDGNISYRW